MRANPLVAPERAQLAAFADELALRGGAEAEPEATGPSLLRSLLTAPEGVVRSVAAGRMPSGLEVVAGPGEPLPSQPLPGDVLLRTVEGGAAHAAVVASPGLLHLDEVSESGLQQESAEPGGYVHTIETAPVARSSEERFARRVTDSFGNLLTDLVLLRLALPQGTGQPAPTVIVQQPPQADIVVGDDQRESEPERLSPLALPATPEVVVRSVATGQPPPEGWRVIAGPSAPLLSAPLEGDVLLRTIEGGAALAEVVTSGGLLSHDRLVQRGLRPDTADPGSFLHVESADRDHRSARRGYARRATDTAGRLLTDLVLLRALQPPTPGQPAPTVVTLPTPGQPAPTTIAQPPRYDVPAPDMPATDIPVTDIPLTDVPASGMPVTEDEIAFAHIDASRLSWPTASAPQLGLMRRVYLGQVGSSGRTRAFVSDVPRAELAEIEQGFQLRRPAAEACRRLLADARTAAAGDPAAANVSRIGLVSGYRSATQQLAIWNRNFPRYYQETRADRQALDGGEFGSGATELLIGYVSGRLAAPGFSLHNNGLAVDFVTEQGGVSMGADTSARNRSRWRGCWLFRWLSDNANGYRFFQNTAIDEPWHWEFRDPGSTAQEIAFTPDTVEPTDAVPAAELTIAAGRAEFSGTPLLASHHGTQPDLILRWNDMADPAAVDVVVHLHGYSADRERMSLQRKEVYSGLDFRNPDDSSDPRMGRTSATLCLLPRGSYTGNQPGVNPERYSFPALTAPSGIRDLIAYGLGQFQSTSGAPSGLSVRRTVLTAHSGGGEALMTVLAHNSPDEIQVFDALYWDASPLIAWMRRRITSEIDGWTVGKTRTDGGLCVLYRGGTATQSRRLSREINRAIAAAPADALPILQAAYRVLRTTVEHGDIPRRYGWLLLADVASHLGAAAQRESETEEADFGEAGATAPPAVVANWPLGVDFSSYQVLDDAAFANLKTRGKVFTIIKCSEGLQPDPRFLRSTDPRFAQSDYYRLARAHGFIRGSYHFFANKHGNTAHPFNTGTIAEQANLVIRQVPPLLPGDLAPALDLEDEARPPLNRFPIDQGRFAGEDGYHYRAGPIYADRGAAGRRELLRDIQDFFNRIETAFGRTPLIYTSRMWSDSDMMNNPADLEPNYPMSNYPLWTVHHPRGGRTLDQQQQDLAHTSLGGWGRNWQFIQYAAEGRWWGINPYTEPGINIPGLDWDAYRLSMHELRGLADIGRLGVALVGQFSSVPSPLDVSYIAHADLQDTLHVLAEHVGREQDSSGTLRRNGGDPVLVATSTALCLYFRSGDHLVEATAAIATPSQWRTSDIEDVVNNNPIKPLQDPRAVVSGDRRHVVYVGDDRDWHLLISTDGGWRRLGGVLANAGMRAVANRGMATGQAAVYVTRGVVHVIGRVDQEGHLFDVWLDGANWRRDDVTALGRALVPAMPAATYSPCAYETSSGVAIVFRAVRGDLWIVTRTDNAPTNLMDATQRPMARAKAAAGHPTCFVLQDRPHIVYRGTDGMIYEIWLEGGTWHFQPVCSGTTHKAAADPVAAARGDISVVAFRGANGQVHRARFNGASWNCFPAAPPMF